MAKRLKRASKQPVRTGLSVAELWGGPDRGLIWCWERGRQKRVEDPELAKRAEAGELVPLAWQRDSLLYAATWQGLRGEELDLPSEGEPGDLVMTCTKTGKPSRIRFRRGTGATADEDE